MFILFPEPGFSFPNRRFPRGTRRLAEWTASRRKNSPLPACSSFRPGNVATVGRFTGFRQTAPGATWRLTTTSWRRRRRCT